MKDSMKEDPASQHSALNEKRTFRSEELFKNDREVLIVHGEMRYRLQITKAGKLILNK
jgi:hemin uptake protein HemP